MSTINKEEIETRKSQLDKDFQNGDIMSISKEQIETRKSELEKDFQTVKIQIEETEKKIITMRNNLNALAGAMQQCDLFLKRIEDDSTPMPEDKKFALDMAAS